MPMDVVDYEIFGDDMQYVEVELDPGDYVMFAGDLPHRYEALAPGTAMVLVMEHV